MRMFAMWGEWAAVMVADLVDLISVLAVAYGVVLGVVALVTGWQSLNDRRPRRRRRRRGVVVPPVGAIARDADGGLR
ncbi:MAG: hypothetical protein ACRDTE_22825 [Pseudonocardiaceae bacterium]